MVNLNDVIVTDTDNSRKSPPQPVILEGWAHWHNAQQTVAQTRTRHSRRVGGGPVWVRSLRVFDF